jgi:hypothetical protein
MSAISGETTTVRPLPGALAHDGRHLVTQRLAAARGHEHQGVAARAHVGDDVGLRAAEGVVAEHLLQHAHAGFQRFAFGGNDVAHGQPPSHLFPGQPVKTPAVEAGALERVVQVALEAVHHVGHVRETGGLQRLRRRPACACRCGRSAAPAGPCRRLPFPPPRKARRVGREVGVFVPGNVLHPGRAAPRRATRSPCARPQTGAAPAGGGTARGLGLQPGPGFLGRQVFHGPLLSGMPRPLLRSRAGSG